MSELMLQNDAHRWQAVLDRNPDADGHFIFAV